MRRALARKEHTDMTAKEPPQKSATKPRTFPRAEKGGHIGVDDAAVLKDGETRLKKPDDKKQQEKGRTEELKVTQVVRKMDDPKPPNLPD